MSFNSSTVTAGDLSPDNPLFWSLPTPVNCTVIRILGIFLCIGAAAGMIFNGALFYSFVRYKALRSPSNIFVMFIAGMGFFASATILPLTGTSSIYCQWLYGREGCQLGAIIAFLYGCSSSYLLCGVSMSRCYIIIRPFKAKDVTVTKCVIISCIAISIAFLWTMLPLMGWNEYTMDRARTSCCINWYNRSPTYLSFLFFLFVFVYCIPLVILVTSNTITLRGLRDMRRKIESGIQTTLSQRRVEMEQRIVRSIIITTTGFIFTWTPYAVTLFVSAFQGKEYTMSPIGTFFCACFAKTSVIWIPMLYVFTSTQFKLRFVNEQGFEPPTGVTNRVEGTVLKQPSQAREIDDAVVATVNGTGN